MSFHMMRRFVLTTFCLGLFGLPQITQAVPIVSFFEGPNDGDGLNATASGWRTTVINVISSEEAIVVGLLDLPLNDPVAPTELGFAGYIIDDPLTRTVLNWVGVRMTPNIDPGTDPFSPIQGPHVLWTMEFFFASDAVADRQSPFVPGYPALLADGSLQRMNTVMIPLGHSTPWDAFGIDLNVQSERPAGQPPTTVPEPGTLPLLLAGLLGLSLFRRQRLT